MTAELVDINILTYSHDSSAGRKHQCSVELLPRWDAQILNSAIELGCSVLWTEDLSSDQRYGSVTARNPF